MSSRETIEDSRIWVLSERYCGTERWTSSRCKLVSSMYLIVISKVNVGCWRSSGHLSDCSKVVRGGSYMIDVIVLTTPRSSVTVPVIVVTALPSTTGTNVVRVSVGVKVLKINSVLVVCLTRSIVIIFCTRVAVSTLVCHVNRFGCSKSIWQWPQPDEEGTGLPD